MGHAASRIPGELDALARLTSRYERVLVNGDALDRCEGREEQAASAPLFERLRKALAGRDGPAEWITGNHDPLISQTHFVYLEEPALLVFHGDLILDCASPWLPTANEFRARFYAEIGACARAPSFADRAALFRRLQVELRPERFESYTRHTSLRYLLRQVLRPMRILTIGRYILGAPRRAAEFSAAYERPVRQVAFAHTHRPGCWELGGVRLFNTGSFMPFSRPYALQVEGREARLAPVDRLLDALGAQAARPAPGLAE